MRSSIEYYHRERGTLEQEQIYGERYLRFVYGHPVGRLLLFAFVKRALFSRLYGALMSSRRSRRKIAPFIETYGIDTSEFVAAEFGSFNEFFHRRLHPSARPVCAEPDAFVLPADGRHSVFPDLTLARPQYIKHCAFDLPRFLGDATLALAYESGAMLVSRLAPVDYHRFHFPVDGHATDPRLIPGFLYSVSPLALERVPRTFVDNKRWVTVIDSQRFGRVVFVEVGATNVGSVVHTAAAGPVHRGDEKGYFLFGGSTVVVLLEPGRVDWSDDLLEHSARGCEVYAKMGERVGTAALPADDA